MQYATNETAPEAAITPEEARNAKLDALEAQLAELKEAAARINAAAPVETGNDWERLYLQQKERAEDLERVIEAGRLQPSARHPEQDVRVKTAEQARVQMGDLRWSKSSEAEKLLALGQDPNQDREFLRKV